MKKFILLIVTFIGIVSWQACQYEWYDPVNPDIPDVVSFSADIMPIFNESCNLAGCHAPGGTKPDLTPPPANAYNNIIGMNMVDTATPENSVLYKKVASGGSMDKYSKPGNPELILKWIQDGAQNN